MVLLIGNFGEKFRLLAYYTGATRYKLDLKYIFGLIRASYVNETRFIVTCIETNYTCWYLILRQVFGVLC